MPWPKGKQQPPEMVAKRKTAYARPEVREKMSAAHRGRALSEEHKQKIGRASLGHTLSAESRQKIGRRSKGRRASEETLARLREVTRRRWDDPEYRQRMSDVHKGQTHTSARPISEETRAKLRQSHLGKVRSIESRLKQGQSIKGEKHHAWRGGKIPDSRGPGWHRIKQVVRERAQGRCEFCGNANTHGWRLDVHHVIPYRDMPISVDWACLALCRTCHRKADHGSIDTSALQATLRPKLESLLAQQQS